MNQHPLSDLKLETWDPYILINIFLHIWFRNELNRAPAFTWKPIDHLSHAVGMLLQYPIYKHYHTKMALIINYQLIMNITQFINHNAVNAKIIDKLYLSDI